MFFILFFFLLPPSGYAFYSGIPVFSEGPTQTSRLYRVACWCAGTRFTRGFQCFLKTRRESHYSGAWPNMHFTRELQCFLTARRSTHDSVKGVSGERARVLSGNSANFWRSDPIGAILADGRTRVLPENSPDFWRSDATGKWSDMHFTREFRCFLRVCRLPPPATAVRFGREF